MTKEMEVRAWTLELQVLDDLCAEHQSFPMLQFHPVMIKIESIIVHKIYANCRSENYNCCMSFFTRSLYTLKKAVLIYPLFGGITSGDLKGNFPKLVWVPHLHHTISIQFKYLFSILFHSTLPNYALANKQ